MPPAGQRVGVLDAEVVFVRAFGERLRAAGFVETRLPVMPSPHQLVALRLSALIIDPVVLGGETLVQLGALCRGMPHMGVIVCTAPVTLAQRLRGLRLGVDDWVAKPCHPEELTARVEAIVRRRKASAGRIEHAPQRCGALAIHLDRYQAFAAGRPLGLTRREFQLLELFAGHEGRVLPREEIYERVWGYAMAHGDRSVDTFVRKLRQKLDAASPDWRYVHTHYGIGYRFSAEGVVDAAEADATASVQLPLAVATGP